MQKIGYEGSDRITGIRASKAVAQKKKEEEEASDEPASDEPEGNDKEKKSMGQRIAAALSGGLKGYAQATLPAGRIK